MIAVISGYEVNVTKLRQFAQETARYCESLYPWYNMPPTIHKYFFHGPESIASALLPIVSVIARSTWSEVRFRQDGYSHLYATYQSRLWLWNRPGHIASRPGDSAVTATSPESRRWCLTRKWCFPQDNSDNFIPIPNNILLSNLRGTVVQLSVAADPNKRTWKKSIQFSTQVVRNKLL